MTFSTEDDEDPLTESVASFWKIDASGTENENEISLSKNDQRAVEILINAPTERSIKQFQYTCLIFGARCSPTTAIFVLQKTANDFSPNQAVKDLVYNSFYMDDFVYSFETIQKAKDNTALLKKTLSKGGFNLTKFVSSQRSAIQEFDDSNENDENCHRVLGVHWNKSADRLFHKKPSKFDNNGNSYSIRKLLSLIACLFDPLGIIAPLVITLKILLQDVWKEGLAWDDPLPLEKRILIQKWIDKYQSAPPIDFPRCINPKSTANELHELHIFSDASQLAYGAVAYIRTSSENDVSCSFLISKAKVAPIKQLSIPKMELKAAVLETRLARFVKTHQSFLFKETVFWCDSTAVLVWIKSTDKLNVYVSNRVREIQDNSSSDSWYHISGKNNPADHVSRGIDPDEVPKLWLTPPLFLFEPKDSWNKILSAEKTNVTTIQQPVKAIIDVERFSKWTKLLKATAQRNKEEKAYICLFNCLVTRAVHLEVTEDLTTTTCMTAIRRFIARRGQPRLFLSDNGSNFLGARKQIRRQPLKLENDFIRQKLMNESVEWHLNPPSAPHFGGVWERLVQIVKRALLLNLASAKLTWDVFSTIVIETESLVNARPLTHVRSDIEEEDPLTPNHFLIGRAFPNVPACVFKETPTIQTKTWTQVRQRLEAIWKRLLKEYIPTLNTRKKWLKPDAKLEVNDVVWVLEEWTPRGIWPLGRVTRTFTGPDKTARSCEVKTALGILTRPAVKLAHVFLKTPPADLPSLNSDLDLDLPSHNSELHLDLPNLKSDLDLNLPGLKSDLYLDLPSLKSDLDLDLPSLKSDLGLDLPSLKSDLHLDLPNLKSDLDIDLPSLKSDSDLELPNLKSDLHLDLPILKSDLDLDLPNLKSDSDLELPSLKSDLDLDLTGPKSDLHLDLPSLKSDLDLDLPSLKSDLDLDLPSLKSDLHSDLPNLKSDLDLDLPSLE
ncbi:uncharacterized protein LOC142348000 [Convolutriloba macropyga]|uniref:uncharacterized protein LOC142348000 n=1 Tax=Convolutriloba macropyga TaxID=536237 RepID=UPI003F51FDBD